jgi:uncharacterized membrane protein YeaQ/YmgE (transglycosylase-associated protein family)
MGTKRGYNPAQKARVENAGVLAASGLIAGEALMGLFIAFIVGVVSSNNQFWTIPGLSDNGAASWLALLVFAILTAYLVFVPLRKAGAPDEPAPPTAVM